MYDHFFCPNCEAVGDVEDLLKGIPVDLEDGSEIPYYKSTPHVCPHCEHEANYIDLDEFEGP